MALLHIKLVLLVQTPRMVIIGHLLIIEQLEADFISVYAIIVTQISMLMKVT